MSESCNRPLLTFSVIAYNQERFIREAVEAALAQTYSPLEVILSDDCSEDRTFEIMRELAEAYRGPHRVVLNRNPVRKSIGGHMNRVIDLSHGELIVDSAGDDVSLPQRTQIIYEAWEWSGRQATSIHSSYIQIDESGRTIEQIYKNAWQGETMHLVEQKVEPLACVRTLDPVVHGCAHAFSRRLFAAFGNLPEHLKYEDHVLAFRSVLAGRLLYINEPLLKYRSHGNNESMRKDRSLDVKSLERHEDYIRRDFRDVETVYETFLLDLETARRQALIGNANFKEIVSEVVRMRRRFSLLGKFLESGFFLKCRILLGLWRSGLTKKEFQTLSRRLLPRTIFLHIRLARNYAALAWSELFGRIRPESAIRKPTCR